MLLSFDYILRQSGKRFQHGGTGAGSRRRRVSDFYASVYKCLNILTTKDVQLLFGSTPSGWQSMVNVGLKLLALSMRMRPSASLIGHRPTLQVAALTTTTVRRYEVGGAAESDINQHYTSRLDSNVQSDCNRDLPFATL